jgi:hypothetical protein
MKNFMAAFGAVAMLAFPAVLVTAPASVSAEEALAETGSEEVSGFSALSSVSADRLSRQEMHDTIGGQPDWHDSEGVYAIERTFWNGKASWHIGNENEEPGVYPLQCGLAGCYNTCRGGSGECESEITAGDLGGIGAMKNEKGRKVPFNPNALMAMCGSSEECLLFPHLHAKNWEGEHANGPVDGEMDFCAGIDGCGPFGPENGNGLAEIIFFPELPPSP